MIKNYFLLIFLGLICLGNASCTVLQWRKSDQEIQQKFRTLGIGSEISYFKVDSLDLKVRIQEISSNGNNVNLVFIHGAPSSLSTWEGYLIDSTLRAASNMYAMDRPGYGYSNFGDDITSIEAQAEIMSAIIIQKKLANVIAIGSSYGGPLAARVGFLNPNVKAIVMISPAIDPKNEKDIWASRFTQWKLTRWLVPTAYRVAGDEKTVHSKELALIENDWSLIQVPIIHIHGDKDEVVPYGNVDYTAKVFKDIKIVRIANKGHDIAWKNLELIKPHLIRLIEGVKDSIQN